MDQNKTRAARSSEDPSKVNKLAKRFLEGMQKAVEKEPRRIDPHLLGVSKTNRLFSIQHVHSGVLESIIKNGHDPSRPQVGICCETTPEEQRELLQHNKDLASQSALMPPADEDMRYEKLACSHYNIGLKCGRMAITSPAGDLAQTKATDESFLDHCTHGHRWIILPSGLDEALKSDIAQWRNQDQNENQTITDGELIRMAKKSVSELLAKAGGARVALPLQAIVTSTCLKSTMRLNPAMVGGYCRFVCHLTEQGAASLLDDFLMEWTATVDPKKLAIPATFFDTMLKTEVLQPHPDLCNSMALAMYTQENATPRPSPAPSTCGFINSADLAFLLKHRWLVDIAQRTLARIRTELKPLLTASERLSKGEIREETHAVGNLLVRVLLGKSLANGVHSSWGKPQFSTGKLSDAKALQALGFWALHLDTKYPLVKFGLTSGLADHYPTSKADDDEVYLVGSVAPPAAPAQEQNLGPTTATGIHAESLVEFTKRTSFAMPLKGNPNFKKDVNPGVEGRVLEVDPKLDRVKVTCEVMNKQELVVVHGWVGITGVKLLDTTAKGPGTSKGSGGAQPNESEIPDAIASAHPSDRVCEWVADWGKLLEGRDSLSQILFLKAKAFMALEEVMAHMPQYGEGDLGIIHRYNANGACRSEVWTLKNFSPGSLKFAPFTAEIKDRLYTTTASVHMDTPRERVPENRMLAFDGRGKNHLQHSDEKTYKQLAKGSLFWVFDRTKELSKANLVIEFAYVTSASLGLQIPGHKAKIPSSWAKDSIPGVPILVNKSVVPKHVKLVAMDDLMIHKAREEDAKASATTTPPKRSSDASGSQAEKKRKP